MSNSNTKKAVFIALIGNGIIALFKFVAAFFTRSASMMAEAIHSSADCLNQVFLLIGARRAKKERDEQHPFGYGREEYFWAFMVATLLFFGGATFSIYEGINKLLYPHVIEYLWLAIIILSASVLIEYNSFRVAYKEFRKTMKGNLLTAIRRSTDINLIVILLEDSAALSGLIIALICTLLSLIFPIFDAIGSICIGIILIIVSVSLANELRKMIIGESMSREDRNTIKDIIGQYDMVKHINRLKTMSMGKNNYLLLLSINVDDFTHGYRIEDITQQMKEEIQEVFPHVSEMYIEINEN
jgi:cation diffusion facilitator family transporter